MKKAANKVSLVIVGSFQRQLRQRMELKLDRFRAVDKHKMSRETR